MVETTEAKKGAVTIADIERFRERHGPRRTSHLLSMLGKRQPLFDAMHSDIGQALFKDTVDELDNLFNKILNDDHTREDTMKYKILKSLIEQWALKLNTYLKRKAELTGKPLEPVE